MTTTTPHGAPEFVEILTDGNYRRCTEADADSVVIRLSEWRRAIQQAAGAVPEGWRIVPVEPVLSARKRFSKHMKS